MLSVVDVAATGFLISTPHILAIYFAISHPILSILACILAKSAWINPTSIIDKDIPRLHASLISP